MMGATIGRRIAKLEAQNRHVVDVKAAELASERAWQWVKTILANYPSPAWCEPEKRSQAELIAASTLAHAELRRYFQGMAEERGARGNLAGRILETAARIMNSNRFGVGS